MRRIKNYQTFLALLSILGIFFVFSADKASGQKENKADKIKRIHKAAAEGNVRELLDLLGSDSQLMNARDDSGATPLHTAAKNDKPNPAIRLLYRGADPDIKDNNGKKAIDYARELGHERIVLLIRDRKSILKEWHNGLIKRMEAASLTGNLRDINHYLDEGLSPNVHMRHGARPIHNAAGAGKIEAVRTLLKRGADPGIIDHYGSTAFHIAAFNNKYEMVDLFLEMGTNVNLKDSKGETPLFCAVHRDDKRMVEKLISKGAFINAQNKEGENALFKDFQYNRDDGMLKLLIDKGIDVNHRNNAGQRAWDLFNTDYIKLKPILKAGGEISYEDFINLVLSKNWERLVFAIQNSPSLQLKLFVPLGILILAVIILFLYYKKQQSGSNSEENQKG